MDCLGLRCFALAQGEQSLCSRTGSEVLYAFFSGVCQCCYARCLYLWHSLHSDISTKSHEIQAAKREWLVQRVCMDPDTAIRDGTSKFKCWSCWSQRESLEQQSIVVKEVNSQDSLSKCQQESHFQPRRKGRRKKVTCQLTHECVLEFLEAENG